MVVEITACRENHLHIRMSFSLPIQKRIHFIDAARAVAILLMLEGHFIDLTLQPEYRDLTHPIYATWHFIRGLTAPLFFSVTGVIFVFLLSRGQDSPRFGVNQRVKRGFQRAFELLFWGYLLQTNVLNFNEYLNGTFNQWNFAFHVLQCLGVGILLLLLLYGLFTLFKKGPLFLYYLLAGVAVFALYPSFKTLPPDQYFPPHAPELIQNLFHGPHSVFPPIPWTGFVLLGGAVGALIWDYREYVRDPRFSLLMTLSGIGIFFLNHGALYWIDFVFSGNKEWFVKSSWLIGRFGQVLIVLGLLMRTEKYCKRSGGLFLKVGQKTLPIYVIHVMILYSGFIGVGLNKVWEESLGPWEATFGATLFMVFFLVLIHYFHHLENAWARIKKVLRAPLSQL